MSTIRTRFAPSPTGYMHIGGMRTALFCWLFARHHGGKFVLRIDDTDQARNQEAALQPILDSFRWLGLAWDEGPEVEGEFGPYYQSQRNEIYQEACQKLLQEQKAFYDFTTPEQSQAEREAAEKEKRNYLNNRNDAELSEAEINSRIERGDKFVIRFKVPREFSERVVVEDLIRGKVEFETATMPDPVIFRGNGTPLYNFASVVDDAAMQISHVIRAEEHLSNTPVQALLFDALGYQRPKFAHIPYVAAPGSKEKLSKRKLDKYRKSPAFKKLFDQADAVFPKLGLSQSAGLDPVMVEYYEKIGYLPEAILNALARIGWSLDDHTEIFPLDSVVENFTLDRVVKSAAAFDPDKLLSYQSHWMNELPLYEKVDRCWPYLEQAGYLKDYPDEKYVARVVEAAGDRLVLFSDILKFDEFFVADDEMEFEAKPMKKRIRKQEDAVPLLQSFQRSLAESPAENAEEFDQLVHQFVDQQEIQIGQIIHALRVAVTGKGAGVGMFDAMAILGKDRCIARIDRAVEAAAAT